MSFPCISKDYRLGIGGKKLRTRDTKSFNFSCFTTHQIGLDSYQTVYK